MPKKAKSSADQMSFEDALKRLEKIVADLENEEIPLEKSIELFEEGKKLSSFCMKRLQEVEKKVKVLIDENNEITLKDFDQADENGHEEE